MNEEFVTFELAKKLKGKGFKEKCIRHYQGGNLLWNSMKVKRYFDSVNTSWALFTFNNLDENKIDAPTIYQALKWLREEKKLFVLPNIDDKGWCYRIHSDLYWNECGTLVRSSYYAKSYFETYEEAALAGIEYTLDKLI